MPEPRPPATMRRMGSYAVVWSEALGPLRSGKLELGREGLELEGESSRSVPYAEIEGLHVGRLVPERIGGRPSIVLELVGGEALLIGSVAGLGTLHELAERLAGLAA
jgi:hypothetical protein